jgi:hypothetical protein
MKLLKVEKTEGETTNGQSRDIESRMDNRETLVTLGTQDTRQTKQNKNINTQNLR